ncbi:MAG TPA: KH domain-containing protein [Acidimicrobiales bacterium]|nr:KH domain-containing protein [Acidimicrobiales bacterium]
MSDTTSEAELADDELDDVDDADEVDGNRASSAIPRAVLEYLARSIVDDPDAVVVEAEEAPGSLSLRLHVAPDDMGRVIGRRGRVAQAIRTVVRAAGAKEGLEADVDIVD